MNIYKEMRSGMQTAFIDSTYSSNILYRPEFIYNDYKSGKKVISAIEEELQSCDSFSISVAFITMSGVTPLLQTLKELEEKGIKGKILTTNYLMFTQPQALRKLMSLRNIEVRMYDSNKAGEGFHTKGYIFKKGDIYRIIVGSSNLTGSAITKNKEWNTKLVSTSEGNVAQSIIKEFNDLWNHIETRDVNSIIDEYTIRYEILEEQKRITTPEEIQTTLHYELQANAMQKEFISNVLRLKEAGEKRVLLISATGTGKTYASAFAIKALKPKRILFIVHREQIAKQALESYKRIFKDSKTFGLLSGNSKEYDANYIFATMQMLSKESVRKNFEPSSFDVIVIDEVHRAGANSYKEIMDYFTPTLYLGMSAIPERSDGFDVFALFDHNVAHEIRLQQAMEENLLCPFHYFGITDLSIVEENMDVSNFHLLINEVRVKHILDKIRYYGYYGKRVKGLVFCSRKEEAAMLSEKFNQNGFKTTYLSGSDSQQKREDAINLLTSDDTSNCLHYIFTVDIFNEGVDIPEINQIIMLRPTQSPIVFVQQLGRGLRKSKGKEFVVILDFIGNYTNNFMIPIALSGNRTYNKDTIRKYIGQGERTIPGESTIHFDSISKQRVYEALDKANFSNLKLIKENYNNLKNRLGHIPEIKDFEFFGELDMQIIFSHKTLGSYYSFLKKHEKEYSIELNIQQEQYLKFLCSKLANGKRPHELVLLKMCIANGKVSIDAWEDVMGNSYGCFIHTYTITNVMNVLMNIFPSGGATKTFETCMFLEYFNDKMITLTSAFSNALGDSYFKDMVEEVIEYGLKRYKTLYEKGTGTFMFKLYQKYTYEDVCRLLEWEKNEVPLNIGGYKFDKKTNTLPVFINYNKSEDISNTIKYEDRFISNKILISLSKSKRKIESEDVQRFLNAPKTSTSVHLFVRKNKDDKESKEFYYLGLMKPSGNIHQIMMSETNESAVEIEWILDEEVREDVYKYIVKE